MGNLHWYPGHIAKAEKQLKEKINLVDVVIEVRDARIPLSSSYKNITSLVNNKPRLVLLNKSDLANKTDTDKWIEYISKKEGLTVIKTAANSNIDVKFLTDQIVKLSKEPISKLVKKGLLPRASRVVIVGLPNVGKSSIINKLTRSSKAKTGAKAGVTRLQQWVRVNPKFDLLDTPGIIPVKMEDQKSAEKLAMVNGLSENAYDYETIANSLLEILKIKYESQVRYYYKLNDQEEITIDNIAKNRNWILKDNIPDETRTAKSILTDFRSGRIGNFTLDELPC